MKQLVFYFLVLNSFALAQLPNNEFSRVKVFENEGNSYGCFRIPAITKAANGDLLAFSEGRVNGCGDHGDIDIVLKRSSDNGVTWGPLQVVRDNGDHVAGNPGPVLDETTGELFLVYNTSETSESQIRSGNGIREVWVVSSNDHGETWGKHRNITLSINKPNEPSFNSAYNFSEDWRWYAVTPGHCFQLKNGDNAGRLIIPGNHVVGSGDWTTIVRSHVFWSDDRGQTWKMGGDAPLGTNEALGVELESGDIMLNMRHYHGGGKRALSVSSDGGETFGPLMFPEELTSPTVQGSIIRYTNNINSDKNRILLSNPDSPNSRINMTVRMSLDEGKTWPISKRIEDGFGAYSDLVIQHNNDIGLFYEGGDGYGDLYYAKFSLAWLSDSSDFLPVMHRANGEKIISAKIYEGTLMLSKIQISLNDINVEIRNLDGNKVKEGLLTKFKMDVSSLRPGVYWLKVVGKKDIPLVKVLKVK